MASATRSPCRSPYLFIKEKLREATRSASSRYVSTTRLPTASAGRSGSLRALRRRRWTRFIVRKREQALGVLGRLARHLLRRPAERPRDGPENVRQKRRLVAPRLGLRSHVARRQVGRVCLEQKPVVRDVAHEPEQVLAAPLVADPSGDADVQAKLQVGVELVLFAGETVCDGFSGFVSPENLRK